VKNRRTLIIAAIALVVVLNIVLAVIAGGKGGKADDPADDPVIHSGTIIDDPALPSDEPETVSWQGCQEATVAEQGMQVYSDSALTQLMDSAPASGQKVIICAREGESCRIRFGTHIGWTKASGLSAVGEPTIYSDVKQQPAPADLSGTGIGDKLDSVAKDHGCVGVQLAVVKDGCITHHYEYGYQDKSQKIPVAADTKIRVASISKVIVGMGVLSMHDMGIVDIDADVSTYWGADIKNPNFPDDPITFRHILTHTSSFNDFGYKKRATSALEDNLQKKTSYMKHRPGDAAAYLYNNSGICAAGAIAGRAADVNFDQYIREYFFRPLNIDSSFHAKNIKAADKISIIYNDGVPTIRVQDFMDYAFYGGPADDYSFYAGGMLISASDYAKLICILLGGGEYDGMYYLRQESIDRMLTVCHENVDDYDQCLVLRRRDDTFAGKPLYYHTGNMAGVYSLMCLDPETGDGLVVITNGAEEPKRVNGVYSVCNDLAKEAAALWAE